MDGRDGMTSFYLYRGVSGSGYRSGGDGGGDGLDGAPPGFKAQPSPNTRVLSIGSSFQLEHNSSPSFPHGITTGGCGRGSGDGGGGGGGVVSITTPGNGNGLVVKKKRGRPRKYGPNESNMALGLTPSSVAGSPGSTTPASRKNRGRPPGSGWKQRLANVGEWMSSSAGLAFTPHIIHVSTGEDVAEKILLFAQQRPRALCILSGHGAVSTVTLRQVATSGDTVTYEGHFEIVCLSGSYLLAETGGSHNRTGGLSISVSNGDRNMIGGAIGGRLIASSLVQVVVCTFTYGGSTVKAKTKPEAPNETSPIPIPDHGPTPNPEAIAWPPDSRTRLRNSHAEIDLTHG